MPKKGPSLFLTSSITGEQREYVTDNEVDHDQSIETITNYFDVKARRSVNAPKAKTLEHIRLMQEKAVEYVCSKGSQGSYAAVFMLMMGTAKYGGRVPLTRAQIQKMLGYSRQTVRRAIVHLKESGMIREALHEGRMYFFIETEAGTKGKAKIDEPIGAKEKAEAKWFSNRK